MKQLLGLLLSVAVLSGCGLDHRDEHEELAESFPDIQGVELVDVEYDRYCGRDNCLFWTHGYSTIYTFEHSPGPPDEVSVVGHYFDTFPDWKQEIFVCPTLESEPTLCVSERDNRVDAYLSNNHYSIHITTLTWDEGTFVVHVSGTRWH